MRQKYNLKIADLYFRVDSYPDEYTLKVFEPYMIPDSECPEDSLSVVCTLTRETVTEPQSGKLTDRQFSNWYSDVEGKYTVCYYDADNDVICARMDYDRHARCAELLLADVGPLFGENPEFFLYNVMEKIFSLSLLFNNGFVIHASSIVHEGYGLAFSAESGTGKSTHTGLWLENYPGTYILNDDSPALRQVNGEWKIYGTPWAGTTGINCNSSAPLKALVFLERSKENKMRSCSALEGIRRIFEAIIHPMSDELTNAVLTSLSAFISTSEICILGCNISADAPKTVKEYLFK